MELIEKVARKWCIACGWDPDMRVDDAHAWDEDTATIVERPPAWTMYKEAADAVIALCMEAAAKVADEAAEDLMQRGMVPQAAGAIYACMKLKRRSETPTPASK